MKSILLALTHPTRYFHTVACGFSLCCAVFLPAGVASAQSLIWTGAGRDMSLLANWDPQRFPGPTDSLVFDGTSSARNPIQNTAAGLEVSGMTYSVQGSITGNRLTLTSLATTHSTANSRTDIDVDLIVRQGGSISAAAGGLLTIGDPCLADEPAFPGACNGVVRSLVLNGPINVNFSGTGQVRVGSVISGSGGINVTGANVNFDRDHTYTGETSVTGLLRIYEDLASPIAVQSGGTLAGIGHARGGVILNSGGLIDPGYRQRNNIGELTISGDLEVNTTASSFVTLGFDVIGASTDSLFLNGALSSVNPRGRVILDVRNVGNLTTGSTHVLIDGPTGGLFANNNTGANRIAFFQPNGTEIVSDQQFLLDGAIVSFSWNSSRLRLLVSDTIENSLGTASWRGTAPTNPDRWSQLANWVTTDVPLTAGLVGRTLSFTSAATAARRITVNDLDVPFWALQFSTSGYQINPLTGSTARLRLAGGIECLPAATGTNAIAQPILLSRAQTFANRSSSELRLNSPIDLASHDLTLTLDPASTAATPRINCLGPITGTGGLVVNQTQPGSPGNTSVTIAGTNRSNTYSGPTRIESGTVILNARTGAPDNEAFVALSSTSIDIGTPTSTAVVTALYQNQILDAADVYMNTGSRLNLLSETLRSLYLTGSETTATTLTLTNLLDAQGPSRIDATALLFRNFAQSNHIVDVAAGGLLTVVAPLGATVPVSPLIVEKNGLGTWDQTGSTSGIIHLKEGTLITRGVYDPGTEVSLRFPTVTLRGNNRLRKISMNNGGIIEPGTPDASTTNLRTDSFLGHSLGTYKPSIFSSTSSSLLSVEAFVDLKGTTLKPTFTSLPAVGSRTKILLLPNGSIWSGTYFSIGKNVLLTNLSTFTGFGGRWRIEYPGLPGQQIEGNQAIILERLSDTIAIPFKTQRFSFRDNPEFRNAIDVKLTATSGPSNSGTILTVETSIDLIQWVPVPNAPSFTADASGTVQADFSDDVGPNSRRRFYRLADP